jgi:hypothetical protein
MSGKSLADQERFDFFQAHFFQASAACISCGAQPQVCGADVSALAHQYRALHGVIQLANVTRPCVFEK